MSYAPPPRKPYKGSITDTDRWNAVDLRAGDVFVCTPPKCGTTWTTSIVTMLCAGRTDIAPQELIHWLDASFMPLDDVVEGLKAQNGRRCIKTHTPMDGIPWRADAHYITVYRHPVDMMLSLRKHLANEVSTSDDHPYLQDPDTALKEFATKKTDDYDDDSLVSYLTHYRAAAQQPRPDNLLMLHYADMLAAPRANIEKIALHIGVSPDPALLDAVTKATSFGNMKANPDRFTPYADKGYWHDPQAFFHAGGTRKWEGKISDETFAIYAAQMADALPPEDINWLENGSIGAAD